MVLSHTGLAIEWVKGQVKKKQMGINTFDSQNG